MYRAVIYARVSSEKQRKDLSIPAQLHECRGFIQSQGWYFFREYAEADAVSAFNAKDVENRHALHRLLEDAEQELFDILVVYDFARFARLREIHVLYESKLNRLGVTLVSVSERVEDSPSGRLLKGILTDMNQFYSETLSFSVKRGQAEMLRQGLWPGKAPVGYKKNNRVCEVDPASADFIKLAFATFAKGRYTLQSWADHAYEEGFKNKKGNKITLGHWAHIFHNKFYVGVMRWGEIEAMGHHVPLVDADIFDNVQDIISRRARNNGAKVKRHYPLSRLLYSDDADSRMIGHVGTSHNGKKHRYYKSVGQTTGGRCHYILADTMEAVFAEFLFGVEAINDLLVGNIDNDILLGLKVANSVGKLYNIVEPHQQLYISKLVVKGRGVHVSDKTIKYIKLNPSFKWTGSPKNKWAAQESNKVVFDA